MVSLTGVARFFFGSKYESFLGKLSVRGHILCLDC